MASDEIRPEQSGQPIIRFGQIAILFFAFVGWAFAGVHMSITSIVMRVALIDLLPAETPEGEIGQWFGWLVCAFLLGAATGGYLFGIIGDRFGRAKAMAASILCYSVFSGVTYFASSAEILLVLRFLTCMGVGGMWPNGIALLSEAWSNVGRPILAGVMGTAANVGILFFAIATTYRFVTAEDWRWTMVVGASPIILAILSFLTVPESPRWLAIRAGVAEEDAGKVGVAEIFKPPIHKLTIIGILLGTIPLFGGWGVSNWASAWASEVGDRPVAKDSGDTVEKSVDDKTDEPVKKSDPALKSKTTIARSLTGSVTSLLGGFIAAMLGRKLSYSILCVCALVCTQFLFRVEDPASKEALFTIFGWAPSPFIFWTAALGFFSGFFFGWLPLCLPELFPTRVRSTGAGVSFNWGRILTTVGILVSAAVLKTALKGQYPLVGQFTGFIYAFGLIVIVFAPFSKEQELKD